ncbi:MAG: hypothetical protein V7L22_14250 [Nostoc sp.]|uniref:hypothetical protein n=1 Tax=Nostoc sp. TaxID=1180 RepID=UPI002FFB67A2
MAHLIHYLANLATPTQKLEQETQRRSQELVKGYEMTLCQYNYFIQWQLFL